jgi:hypothetical protein
MRRLRVRCVSHVVKSMGARQLPEVERLALIAAKKKQQRERREEEDDAPTLAD